MAVTLAGCASFAGSAGRACPDPAATGADTSVPAAKEYPAPPTPLTAETARDVAADYERACVYNLIRTTDIGNWGVGGWTSVETSVVDRGDGWFDVRVTMPYSYEPEGDGRYRDARTEVVVRVSTDRIERKRVVEGVAEEVLGERS